MGVDADLATLRTATPRPANAASGPRWLVPALLISGVVALVVCLFIGGSANEAALAGLPDAGAGTRWALPVASFIAETAAVLALGAALLAAALIPRADAFLQVRRRCLGTAGSLAGLAAAASLVAFVVTLSDLTARPLPQALTGPALLELASFGPGLLLLLSAALSALGAAAAWWASRHIGHRPRTTGRILPVAILAAALIPWALGGHTAQAGQDIAAPALIVHVLAAGAWLGGLAIMVLHIRGDLLLKVLPRFSALALWCWIAIGTSGIVAGWLRVGSVSDLWTTGYGRLLLIKLLALGVLGTFGAWHRRRLTAGLRTLSIGQRSALIRVAAVEVLVMGATMGVATALSATAPPVGHATGHESAHGTPRIEAMLGHQIPVISPENLLILWRPDVIVLLISAIGLACYLAGVRRFRAGGRNWPTGRIWWAIGATAVAVLATNSGIATYDGAVWSVAVTQQAITSMVIPLGIVMARPWMLIPVRLCTGRAGDAIRAFLARPLVVLAVYAGWTALGLLTPLALFSVENHAVLMISRIGDIAVGVTLFAVLTGSTTALPGRRKPLSRNTLLLSWFAVEAGFSVLLLAGGATAARPWFTELNLAWITVTDDERTAALIHIGIAIAVLLVVAGLPPESNSRIGSSNSDSDDKSDDFAGRPIISGDGAESIPSSISVTADRPGR